MESVRKPFQGVWNIMRFNWHFYLLSIILILLIFLFRIFGNPFHVIANIVAVLIIYTIAASLLTSWYIYDVSGLYNLHWANQLMVKPDSKIININAGFDETSILLKNKYPGTELVVLDFYNPANHTEVSISRARKAYPPFPGTIQVNASSLPLPEEAADLIFVILAAHEIRREAERSIFFNELRRVLKRGGKIIVMEHIRDLPNFLAFNIGFFHFIPKSSWYKTFKNAGLTIFKEIKLTPFISTFILEKYGITS